MAGICFANIKTNGQAGWEEYIQRTGGWEHLWPEVAAEMGENQIGAEKKSQSFPGAPC